MKENLHLGKKSNFKRSSAVNCFSKPRHKMRSLSNCTWSDFSCSHQALKAASRDFRCAFLLRSCDCTTNSSMVCPRICQGHQWIVVETKTSSNYFLKFDDLRPWPNTAYWQKLSWTSHKFSKLVGLKFWFFDWKLCAAYLISTNFILYNIIIYYIYIYHISYIYCHPRL